MTASVSFRAQEISKGEGLFFQKDEIPHASRNMLFPAIFFLTCGTINPFSRKNGKLFHRNNSWFSS
jgi:hypothetical protein